MLIKTLLIAIICISQSINIHL